MWNSIYYKSFKNENVYINIYSEILSLKNHQLNTYIKIKQNYLHQKL